MWTVAIRPREYVKTSKTGKETVDRMVQWSNDSVVGGIRIVS